MTKRETVGCRPDLADERALPARSAMKIVGLNDQARYAP